MMFQNAKNNISGDTTKHLCSGELALVYHAIMDIKYECEKKLIHFSVLRG